MLQIVQTNLDFTTPCTPRRLTKRMIFHHSAGETGDAYAFHRQHINQGWRGIGYNFVILRDGTIQAGRPHNCIGSHSGPTGNPDSIGVCVMGNFMNHPPTDAQVESCVWLYRQMVGIYGQLDINGHREFMQTACPGTHFPLDKIRQLSLGGNSMVTGPIQSWETQHIQLALQNGFFSQLHDPREPICYSELAAILNNFYAKNCRGK